MLSAFRKPVLKYAHTCSWLFASLSVLVLAWRKDIKMHTFWKLGVVAKAFTFNTWKAEAGQSRWVWGRPGLIVSLRSVKAYSEILSQKPNQTIENLHFISVVSKPALCWVWLGYTQNPSTRETEKQGVPGHPQLQSDFRIILCL